jgi:hypothetical protein
MLLVLSVVIAAAGAMMILNHENHWLAWVVAGCGLLNIALLVLLDNRALSGASAAMHISGKRESDDITGLSLQRRRELVRGTSLYLRELNYRYSIRLDSIETTEHRPISAEENTVKLGFVPVVIIDNSNDRQGKGYVAFVHDGNRWRGPGLPCPSGQVEAVRLAAKCVSPLS